MEGLFVNTTFLVVVTILWVLPWKAYSLWTASRMNHKRWFIALIVFNTFAILDIFYIFYIAKKTPKDLIRALKNVFKK